MDWKIEPVPELNGYTVEWAEAGNFYLSRRNAIYRSADLKPPFEKIAAVEAPFWKAAASRLRPAQRLLRFAVTNVIPLTDEEVFITFDKTVGVLRDGAFRTLEGLERPCRVLRSACAVDGEKSVFFGEYLANDERGAMRVYEHAAGSDRLRVVYTFPAGSIKHVHGLYFDRSTNSIFCLTGDDEAECQILRSDDRCRTFETVGRGDETWRAVSLLFDEDNFYYGTDAEFRTNHIYRVNRNTLERTQLGEVDGTIFYSKRVGTDLFFATTAENAPSQKENVASIWHLGTDGNIRKLVSYRKDFWHPTLFQFGTIGFPGRNLLDTQLYFYLTGLEHDDRTFRLVNR
jgi:hypothetical protein